MKTFESHYCQWLIGYEYRGCAVGLSHCEKPAIAKVIRGNKDQWLCSEHFDMWDVILRKLRASKYVFQKFGPSLRHRRDYEARG